MVLWAFRNSMSCWQLSKKRKWMQSKAMHITSYNALHKLRDAILQVLPHELLTAGALLWSVIAGRAVHKGATKPKSSAKQFCWPWWFWILPRLMSHSQYRQYPWKSHEVSLPLFLWPTCCTGDVYCLDCLSPRMQFPIFPLDLRSQRHHMAQVVSRK